MRIAWLTDIHLNFLATAEVDRFLHTVVAQEPDAVLITGDIGEAHSVANWLEKIDEVFQRPIYFVLGNHDFYGGSIAAVREHVETLCQKRPNLVYLTASDAIELKPHIALIGDDGWADGRLGSYEKSLVMMNDYRLIAELAPYSKRARWEKLKQLGDEAASHIRRLLPLALEKYPEIILATHLPPLREACWHEGQLSDDEWAPHFTCKAMGDAILEIMRSAPKRNLTVYCGHTHSPGICQPLPNLTIYTGGAKYGQPALQRVIELN